VGIVLPILLEFKNFGIKFRYIFIHRIDNNYRTVQKYFKLFPVLPFLSPSFKTGKQFTDADYGKPCFICLSEDFKKSLHV